MNYIIGSLVILCGILIMLIKPREVVRYRISTEMISPWDTRMNARFEPKD